MSSSSRVPSAFASAGRSRRGRRFHAAALAAPSEDPRRHASGRARLRRRAAAARRGPRAVRV